MTDESRHRTWRVLRGSPGETAERAQKVLAAFDSGEIAWVSDLESDAPDLPTHPLRSLTDLLGTSFSAVALELHTDFDPDALGQVHGLVRGGGALLLRLPPRSVEPDGLREGLAAHPYDRGDVGTHLWRRLLERLDGAEPPRSVAPPPAVEAPSGTAEQESLVERLEELLRTRDGVAVVTADRGRGKSSALGLALEAIRRDRPEFQVVVASRRREATREIFRFGTDAGEVREEGPVRWVAPGELLDGSESPDALLVDEAAQIPVPVLQRLVRRHDDVPVVFATTTHGYEGTGRGFEVGFSDWLAGRERAVHHFELEDPIRWAAGDPLESLIFEVLLLDAEPPTLPEEPARDLDDAEYTTLGAETLSGDEGLLRQTFGLLVRAHYRTRPRDLQKMLDAPNLSVHALVGRHGVLAVTWTAEEGNLPRQIAERLYRGRERIRGHALPEIFASKLGHEEGALLESLRSVRTAVHPKLQRRGLGTRLIECVHETHDPDLFGTVFSASADVIDFRRSVGHEIVRLGTSRSRRTGQPSVTMMRPVSEAADAMFARLRREFARKLPVQLELLRADRFPPLDGRLIRRLRSALPEVGPADEETLRHHVTHYAFGPRTYESAADSIERFVERHAEALAELAEEERRLIEARVRERRSWRASADAAGVESVRAAMRGLRRALRSLVERVG